MEFLIVSYYHYTHIGDPERKVADHLVYCKKLKLRGRIYIAEEGINGTISGSMQSCQKYMSEMQADPELTGIRFKADESEGHAFNRLHVRLKKEIVFSGLRNPEVIDPTKTTGTHVNGEEFQELMKDEDAVILDVRSNYETRLGKFKNAVTLDMENFREFPSKIEELDKYKNKKVVTYCTGGVKCEKASAYLLHQGFKDVYQLHDGIIGYSKEMGGKDFDGVLYVFDGRITVPVNHINPKVISLCKKCNKPAVRNLNCANVNCNEQYVMCESCADKMEGACSEKCMSIPGKRPYNGTGYYTRPPLD